MGRPFTQREWFGLIAGVCWGLVLSRFFGADDRTGLWLAIVFGPPVMLSISPARPLLSWQLPIVTAALAGAFMNRTTNDSAIGALAQATLAWFLCSLLSWPWALMFHSRFRRFRELGQAPRIPIAYVGMVLLVFVCCALTFLGLASPLFFADANDTRNVGIPFYGVLMVTGGILLSIVTERLARKLEIQKLVRGVFEVLMIPGVILGVLAIGNLVWLMSTGHQFPDGSVWCGSLAGMEALSAMIWLTRLDRREQGRGAQPQ